MQFTIEKKIKMLLVFLVLIFTTSMAQAAIIPSDKLDYEIMATGGDYTVYFSQFDTNGFSYVISDHIFSFLPRKLLYTDDNGTPTQILGYSHFTQLQNTTDMVYYNNPYGLENQLQYLSNPLMVKEVYVMSSLPTPPNLEDWLTMSSIAINDDLELKYIDENGEEQKWTGLKTKSEEIRFYDSSNNFIFEFPQPVAKDAADNMTTGHYLIYEDDGILYIAVRFSYASLADMTLPIYLDLSLAKGKVAFGKTEYLIGDTLDVWARGNLLSDERTLLYNPSGTIVQIWDEPEYADGWTSKYTYISNVVGTWKAELQTRSFILGEWEVKNSTSTEVIQQPTDPTGTVYGYVKSSTGESLTNVNLEIDTGESTSTGYDNEYTLDVSEGQHDVTASCTGYISKTKTVSVQKDSSTRLDFTLVPKSEKGELYGEITSTTGEPIEYITVTVDTGESTSTGSNNQYTLDVSEGQHDVTASRTGYISKTRTVSVQKDISTRLDFALVPTSTSEIGVLYGKITSITGEPINYITVTVDTGESTSTDSDNDYAMFVSVGEHDVTASLDGYYSQTKPVTVKKSGNGFTPLDFILEPKVQLLPDLSITSADISFEKVI